MPKLKKPTNDQDRLTLLDQAKTAAEQDNSKGKMYLLPDTYNRLITFVPGLQAQNGMVEKAKSIYSTDLEGKQSALDDLATHVRDSWETVKRTVARKKLPAQVLPLYGMNLDGTIPVVNSKESWIAMADTVINGDKEAANRGYPVCGSPTAQEISEVRDIAKKETAEAKTADSEYVKVQGDMGALRVESDDLIDQVIAELNLTLRKETPSSQRRIMRRYGIRFEYLPGEPEDKEEPKSPEPAEVAAK